MICKQPPSISVVAVVVVGSFLLQKGRAEGASHVPECSPRLLSKGGRGGWQMVGRPRAAGENGVFELENGEIGKGSWAWEEGRSPGHLG